MSDQMADLRRHPRSMVAWPVTVEAGGRSYERQTVNLSPVGAKVQLEEELPVGSNARLRFRPPQGQPLDVDAVVWRADSDGPAFFFVSVDDESVSSRA
jgi:PilZ domain